MSESHHPAMTTENLKSLALRLRAFASERDWEQFHSPKNLSMALTVEAAELLEHFQWLTEQESQHLSENARQEVALELADVFIYLIRLADVLVIDLEEAARRKITINEAKYPAVLVKGQAKKYTDYSQE